MQNAARVLCFVLGALLGALVIAIVNVQIERSEKDYQGRGELSVLIRHEPNGQGGIGGCRYLGDNDGRGRAVIWFADHDRAEQFRHYLLKHAWSLFDRMQRLDPDAAALAEQLSLPEAKPILKKILEDHPQLGRGRVPNP